MPTPERALTPADFKAPAVRLCGKVDYAMYTAFRGQLDPALDRLDSRLDTPSDGPSDERVAGQGLVVVELSTLGGDPEVARMMGEDVRFASEQRPSCRMVFLGKAAIYSAGTTFMSFFARRNRFLTRGTRLMIHERKMNKELKVAGPLTTCVAGVEAVLHELRCSIAIQNEGFANLIRGSRVEMEEVLRRAPSNWYVEAAEAQGLGLIEGVL